MSEILFYLFGGLTALCAMGMAVARDIVRAAVLLLFCLLAVAGIFLLLSAPLLAVVQVIVYAGGTLALIIFGVMHAGSSPSRRPRATRLETAIAGILGILLMIALGVAFAAARFPANPASPPADAPATFGLAFPGEYLIAFELAGVLLLVAVIGAAHLARRRHET